MPDSHANFATSLVATAPSPATSGTSLVVTGGEGTRFPTAPFNATVCPVGSAPTPANAEIVRVTGISTDTFTITRAQESSSARTVIVGDRIYAGPTAKSLTDIETRFSPAGNPTRWVAPIGPFQGDDRLMANGTSFYTELVIPGSCTLTGLRLLLGTVAATGSIIFALWDSSGAVVANTALAGTAIAAANTWQAINFTSTYAVIGPAQFFAGFQANTATARFKSVTDQGVGGSSGTWVAGGSTTGTFGTLPTITPPTAFASQKMPIMWTY